MLRTINEENLSYLYYITGNACLLKKGCFGESAGMQRGRKAARGTVPPWSNHKLLFIRLAISRWKASNP